MKKYLGLRGQALNLAVGTIAGCDFLLFGYDQGVMGGILTLSIFLDAFPMINPNAQGLTPDESSTRSTYQGIAVASYNLGCFLGALITIFIGNPLGRKRVIMLGTSIMVIGAILQSSSTTLEQFIIGRIITGLGNGGNTSTVPTWQSETSKAHKRGKMIFFCIIILVFIPFLPESPRWLILKGREDEAREVIAALADTDVADRAVENEFLAIKETVEEMAKGTFADLFTMDENRNLHRTLLAYFNQVFQQISGINLITYYAAVIYHGLGMSDFLSRLLAALNGTEYFLASWPAVFLVERVGRRKLMLFGAVGQAATMAILAGVNSRTDATGFQIAGIVFLFVFNTFFAVGWLGMTWLYPAEIVPLRIRAPANALSTSANWIFNFLVVMITPVAFNNIGYRTYIIFAAINASMVPCVYFFYPETAYRSLEEMDTIFHKVSAGWRGVFAVVHQARVEPRWFGKHGEVLVDYEKTEEHRRHVAHRQGVVVPDKDASGEGSGSGEAGLDESRAA
ncbi:uncharacterized protein THITE_2040319 [Thermothielavioides terrestris NRRL 8126]|uniref:Major facilitator superfamily (MFS) profile domain-containing protein n=1 Tax=Thermothielavioides terrestris (strain ATCC 38088 / NRRL 8126) TaxID=578455 RepID=G2QU04_THETT|nr:uncharacterized protein THITE_2040319 [Thermothielavioides terrestris NRRL 8126]AEO63663.1 hypothetical protein THITE_2040319 [Thermothielavioides terrestris NRRL 8126]